MRIEDDDKNFDVLAVVLFEKGKGNKTLVIDNYKINGTGVALSYSLKTLITYKPDDEMIYV